MLLRVVILGIVLFLLKGMLLIDGNCREASKSPRGGKVYYGVTNGGERFVCRFSPPVRVPLTLEQSNEVASVYGRISFSYERGELAEMLKWINAMPDVVAETKAPIILMHRKGTSKDMQQQCEYKNVVQEVTEYLLGRAALLQERQAGPDKIILDPGIGFAKNDEQNLRLIQNLNALTVNAYPVLMAASRKTTIGNVLGVKQSLPPEERLEGTLAITAAAVYAGASLVRVHDVKENVRLIHMLEAIRKV